MEDIVLYSIVFIVLLGIGLIVILLADKKQSRKIKEVNDKVQKNPKYLDSRNDREMANRALSMVAYAGPYTLVQARRLKRSLSKYK